MILQVSVMNTRADVLRARCITDSELYKVYRPQGVNCKIVIHVDQQYFFLMSNLSPLLRSLTEINLFASFTCVFFLRLYAYTSIMLAELLYANGKSSRPKNLSRMFLWLINYNDVCCSLLVQLSLLCFLDGAMTISFKKNLRVQYVLANPSQQIRYRI